MQMGEAGQCREAGHRDRLSAGAAPCPLNLTPELRHPSGFWGTSSPPSLWTRYSSCTGRLGPRSQCLHLMGQPMHCSAADAGLWGEEAMVMAPPPMHDSAVSLCFHGCPAFLHSHFPPQPPPSHPLNLSLHSQQQPSPWDCSTILKLQLPATVPSR